MYVTTIYSLAPSATPAVLMQNTFSSFAMPTSVVQFVDPTRPRPRKLRTSSKVFVAVPVAKSSSCRFAALSESR